MGERAMMDSRSLTWLIAGNVAASLARLAEQLDAGELDRIDQIRSTWQLRNLRAFASPIDDQLIAALIARIDPEQRIPAEPDIRALRWWMAQHGRNQRPGAIARLAAFAGIRTNDLSRFRNGGCLVAGKVERLAAALVAGGMAEDFSHV